MIQRERKMMPKRIKEVGARNFEDAWYYVICTDNGMEGTIVI